MSSKPNDINGRLGSDSANHNHCFAKKQRMDHASSPSSDKSPATAQLNSSTTSLHPTLKIIPQPGYSLPWNSSTWVNREIWNSLQPKTRSMDIKIQKVEQAALKGMVPIVSCIALMSNKDVNQKAIVTNFTGFNGHNWPCCHRTQLRRRELIKPDLNKQFTTLCYDHVPLTGLLFRDNLSQQCKDIQETNKFGQRSSSFVAPKSDRAQHRGKSFSHRGQPRRGNAPRQKPWQYRKPSTTRQQFAAK